MGKRMIGIDLGTTYSLAAVMEDGRPVIVANAEGGRLTPSVVALLQGQGALVGQLAKRQAAANPERTIFSIKRRMGRGPAEGAQASVVRSIKRRMGSDYRVRVDGREYTPEEISSLILRKIKEDAQARLGERVEKAVITVPAYFNDSQRRATRDAGRLAGLEVTRLLSEPTAAALAYGLHQEEVHTVLVWDLGGGTFDVSILELGDGFFQVKSVGGDPSLGGDDYDLRLAEHLAEAFLKEGGIDLREAPSAWQRLMEAAEAAKIELSVSERTLVRLPLFDTGQCLERELARAEFEALTRDLTRRMERPTRQALKDAGLSPADIHRLLLVGGSTRMPAIRDLAREVLGVEPHPHTVNPDEAVALGAAIQAGILSDSVQGVALVDVTPLTLGIETLGGLSTPLIKRNTPIPVTRTRIFTTAQDGQAAVEVHVLQGERALAKDNVSLGRFSLSGIEPQGRGQARIEVAFEIDVDGTVRASAWDLQTDARRKVEIFSPEGLSEAELGRLIEEARSCAGEDLRTREGLEAGTRADSMIRAAEEEIRLSLNGGGPPAGLRQPLDDCERAILELKGTLAAGEARAIRDKTDALEERIKALRRRQALAASASSPA